MGDTCGSDTAGSRWHLVAWSAIFGEMQLLVGTFWSQRKFQGSSWVRQTAWVLPAPAVSYQLLWKDELFVFSPELVPVGTGYNFQWNAAACHKFLKPEKTPGFVPGDPHGSGAAGSSPWVPMAGATIFFQIWLLAGIFKAGEKVQGSSWVSSTAWVMLVATSTSYNFWPNVADCLNFLKPETNSRVCLVWATCVRHCLLVLLGASSTSYSFLWNTSAWCNFLKPEKKCRTHPGWPLSYLCSMCIIRAQQSQQWDVLWTVT